MSTTLTLISKPGCHLCSDAREVVLGVIDQEPVGSVVLSERSILDDPALFERYSEDIPVILVDGVFHDRYRVDPDRLRSALAAARAQSR